MTRWHIIGGVLLVLLVIGAAVYLKKSREPVQPAALAGPAAAQMPAFSFPDATGALVELEQVQADVRIVTFWASWSPYSVEELPALAELKKKHGNRIAVVALNRDTDPAEGRRFLEALEVGSELMFAYDQGDTYFKEVGGFNMPETVFVDAEGGVLAHVHGPMTFEAMDAQVQELLNMN